MERERERSGGKPGQTQGSVDVDPILSLKFTLNRMVRFPLLECIRFDGREQSSPRTVSGFLVLVGKENVMANGPYKYLELRR